MKVGRAQLPCAHVRQSGRREIIKLFSMKDNWSKLSRNLSFAFFGFKQESLWKVHHYSYQIWLID